MTEPEAPAFERAREQFQQGVAAFGAGALAQAAQHFEASLHAWPGRVSTLVNLAAVRLKQGEPALALPLLDQALAQPGEHADAHGHRGLALAALGREQEALAAFDRALQIDPALQALRAQRALSLLALGRAREALSALESLDPPMRESSETLWHRGRALQALQRNDEALAAYRAAVAREPGFGPAWGHLGGLLKDLGHGAEAQRALREACRLQPEEPVHRFLLASLEGREVPPQPPADYVRGLFDGYADSFDHHLVDELHYRVPQLALQLLAAHDLRRGAVLDLGCGTGLMGAALAPQCAAVDGVDLSPRMLALAARRGVYRSLFEAEVVEHLRRQPGAEGRRYACVTATDVFIYIGELDEVFAAVARVLEPAGLFVFSVELCGDEHDHRLGPQSRYAQSRAYLRRLAERHRFAAAGERSGALREEQRQPVEGLVLCLQRRAEGGAGATAP